MTGLVDEVWLDEHHELAQAEFLSLSGLTAVELQYLVDCDMLLPVTRAESASANALQMRFSAQYLVLARVAARLRNDFDLDLNGLALTLQMLNRIQQLEAELRDLRAQGPQGQR